MIDISAIYVKIKDIRKGEPYMALGNSIKVSEYDRYYERMLEEGLEFQDEVSKQLWEMGIILKSYLSRSYQYSIGENMFGAEIKYDKKFRETGNLYIETAEKSNPYKSEYVKSGVYRNDNAWLYIIGDKELFYIFSSKHLKMLEANCKTVTTSTSQGFLLPIKDAQHHCIREVALQAC